MAVEDLAESLEGKGWLGVLAGAVIVAPFIPAVGKRLRPAAKGAMKGYFRLADATRSATAKAREWGAETAEHWTDVVEEARAEQAMAPEGTTPEGTTSEAGGASPEGVAPTPDAEPAPASPKQGSAPTKREESAGASPAAEAVG